jgi:hypothetical protein
MTNKEIIAMAKQVFDFTDDDAPEEVITFARLIAKRQMGKDAEICAVKWNGDADTYEWSEACNECAAAILAQED